MSNIFKARQKNATPFENLEQRTLFSGYGISVVAPLPALSTTFVNTQPATLVRDSAGNLYGVDPQGGAADYGTVFEVNPTTRALTVLYTFDGAHGAGPLALAIDASGNLFGITQYATATGSGSTENPSGAGNLFEITAADRSSINVLYTFSDSTVDTSPTALLVDPSNNVDVLADGAGANDGGALLQFSPSSSYGTAAVLAPLTTTHFVYSNTLVRGSDGTLYGTSFDGGGTGQGDGAGTLFSLAPGSSTINTLATFDKATTGSQPQGAPYVDSSGNVFGTSQTGSSDANFYGDVWEYVASSGTLNTVAAFSSSISSGGIEPVSGVVPDANGNLLGTTTQGVGSNSAGTVFSANPTTHTITDVASFTSTTTGASGEVTLTPDGSGNYFGVTASGAANGSGAVFEVSPSSGTGTGTGTGTGGGGTGTVTPVVAKSTVPTTIIATQKAKTGAVSVTITNSGTAVDASTTQLYATTDGSIDSTSLAIGKPSKKISLKAGKSGKATVSLPNLSLPVGTYTILAQTTDTAGAVSIASGPSLTVVAPVITLSATVSAVKPALPKVGKPVSFVISISNTGDVASTAAITFAVGLSTDGVNLTVPITTVTKSPKIKPNAKPTKITAKFKLPTDLDFVDYFPFVTITQGATTVSAAGPSFSPIFSAR